MLVVVESELYPVSLQTSGHCFPGSCGNHCVASSELDTSQQQAQGPIRKHSCPYHQLYLSAGSLFSASKAIYFHELWASCPWMGMQEKTCSACIIILHNKLRWHGMAVSLRLELGSTLEVAAVVAASSYQWQSHLHCWSLQVASIRFRLGWILFCCGFCVWGFWFGFFCENVLMYHQLPPHYILGFLWSNQASCWSLWSFHWNCCHSSCSFHFCVRRCYSCR